MPSPSDLPDSAAVEVVGLEVRRGHGEQQKLAVDGLTLRAPRGAVTAVLGPNGAGKTTTVETCEGLQRRSAGTVLVLGKDPATSGRWLRERVGVMLQDGGVAGAARADEALAYAAGLYRHPLDVAALASRLGIDAFARTPFRRLSGGEQQRVKLALAVVGRPELVFLDEPSAGLDPQARIAAWELVRDLRDAGVSVILTTHLMDEAEQLADHVVIMDAGRAVAAGRPVELMAQGAERSVRFTARPALDVGALVARLAPGTAVVEEPAGCYLVTGDVGPELLAAVTAWCADEGVMPEGLSVQRQSLEQVFLGLTGKALR